LEASPAAGPAVLAPSALLLDFLADLARRFARLREDQRFAWQRGLAQMRRLYLLAGHHLADEGVLASAEDVFFLTADEVREATRGPTAELRGLAVRRRASYTDQQERFAREGPGGYPPFLRGDQPLRIESPDVPSPHAAGSAAPLHGQPVSPGIGRGRARVVGTPEDLAAVQPGEVLVARGADPGWTLVFDRLAALVTESGGQLSHAAVVAREFRLPAVLGVSRATEAIHTGDELVVDGATGAVEVESPGADRQYVKEDE
jgi:rifampicin phosphotransferase